MTPPPRKGRKAITPVGLRDHVLAAMLACAAASGGRLTQTRVLALRVDDVPRVVAGLPFGAKVCELVRELARVAGLSGSDPVAWSRKRGADGRRRAVSRVQAYRIVRDRTGSGWSGTVRQLVTRSVEGTSDKPAIPMTRPVVPSSTPRPPSVRDALGLWPQPPARPPSRGS
jgi:hypothetical protein